ncbi:MAG TPA: hypothetical protein VEC93_15105 [Anaerolineae bacterium]|nr:hypothetical protein [Anaerolineae bacterium]
MESVLYLIQIRQLLDDLEKILSSEQEKKDAEIARLQTENAYLKATQSEIINDAAEFRNFVNESSRHIRKLIIAYSRRLQLLQMQEALKGIDTPPETIIEIQDIRLHLEKLVKAVRESETKSDYLTSQLASGDEE